MSNLEVIKDLWVCVDCGYTIANGEPLEDATLHWKAAFAAGLEREAAAGYHWVSGSAADRAFTFAACDCCGSRLGGTRMSAALIGPPKGAAEQHPAGEP